MYNSSNQLTKIDSIYQAIYALLKDVGLAGQYLMGVNYDRVLTDENTNFETRLLVYKNGDQKPLKKLFFDAPARDYIDGKSTGGLYLWKTYPTAKYIIVASQWTKDKAPQAMVENIDWDLSFWPTLTLEKDGLIKYINNTFDYTSTRREIISLFLSDENYVEGNITPGKTQYIRINTIINNFFLPEDWGKYKIHYVISTNDGKDIYEVDSTIDSSAWAFSFRVNVSVGLDLISVQASIIPQSLDTSSGLKYWNENGRTYANYTKYFKNYPAMTTVCPLISKEASPGTGQMKVILAMASSKEFSQDDANKVKVLLAFGNENDGTLQIFQGMQVPAGFNVGTLSLTVPENFNYVAVVPTYVAAYESLYATVPIKDAMTFPGMITPGILWFRTLTRSIGVNNNVRISSVYLYPPKSFKNIPNAFDSSGNLDALLPHEAVQFYLTIGITGKDSRYLNHTIAIYASLDYTYSFIADNVTTINGFTTVSEGNSNTAQFTAPIKLDYLENFTLTVKIMPPGVTQIKSENDPGAYDSYTIKYPMSNTKYEKPYNL